MQLAEFAASASGAQIPPAVRHQAVRTFVNWVACALGGARDATVEAALAAVRPFAGAPQATLIGRTERLDAPHAALLNGISSHVLDFDDTHLATLVHPSGPVLSALAALAAHRPLSGSAFIDAAVMGIEAECRIALGLGKPHYDMGWHVTGTAGVCGAAVAAGRALGLDTRRMAWAIGIAATQAAGLREMFGSMCKSLHAGKAAQNGLSAALMAQAGFTSSEQALEAPRGMARVMSSEPAVDRILDGLGTTWETAANTFKPYACGLVIHPVIDACRVLAGQGVDPTQIAQVDLQVHPLVVELTGKPRPADPLEAKFSVFHCAAATLLDGNSRLSHFSEASVADPRVTALRDKVHAQVRPDIRKDEARVILVLQDGQRREAHVAHALGSLERPMTDDDLTAKFRELAEGVLSRERTDAALRQCWSVDGSAPVGALMAGLAG